MELGIIWRYRQSRNMDWQTDYDKYMFQVQQALAADSPQGIINLSSEPGERMGISVPELNWTL